MKPGGRKVFDDRQALYVAINLRRIGWSSASIALIFGCDRTSVEHQMRKFGIIPETEVVYSIEKLLAQMVPEPPRSRWFLVNGERVNAGRSYKDYFANRKVPASYIQVEVDG